MAHKYPPNSQPRAAMLLAACLMTPLPASAASYLELPLSQIAQPQHDIDQGRANLMLLRPNYNTINNHGDVVGASSLSMHDYRPFYFNSSSLTAANLGDLTNDFAAIDDVNRNGASNAYGINDAGWVVGTSSTASGFGTTDDRPYLWHDDDGNHANTLGEMRQLDLNPGATWGAAVAVNNSGYVVISGDTGLYRTEFALNAGVLTETGTRTYIGPKTPYVDMNDNGDTVYTTNTSGHVWRDLNNNNIADPGETAQVPPMSAAHPNAHVFAINNSRQVLGMMQNDFGREIGFIWTDLDQDNQFDWDDLNSNNIFEANETSDEIHRFHGNPAGINANAGSTLVIDLNDHGQVVGSYVDPVEGRRAVIYHRDDGFGILEDMVEGGSSLPIRRAVGINNRGQIAAIGQASGSTTDHATLLTPIITAISGDLNGDGFVGVDDLNIILAAWNQAVDPGVLALGDATGDGFVGVDDLNTVLSNWNAGAAANHPPASRVPEPGTAATLLAFTASVLPRRRTKPLTR